MKVKTKIINKDIPTPSLKYAKKGDAGIDLTATSKSYDEFENVVYGTNRAFEIPEGYVGLLFPRSSNANKDLILSNSVGVIDSGYRGEVLFKFKSTYSSANIRKEVQWEDSDRDVTILHSYKKLTKNISIDENFEPVETLSYINQIAEEYEIGDRIGQLIILPYPTIEFEETDELTTTERGTNGYGHTGN